MMDDEVIDEMINTCVLMRTRLVSRVITNIYDGELRPFGINSAQLALLVVISKLSPVTAAEIGRFHHQDRSTLTRNLKIMFSEGWIEEDQALASGRARPIVLTKAGRDLLHDVAPAWRAGQAQAHQVLGEAGVNTITDIANGILFSRQAA
jgi:DNA-binding MarR family transcriptional regulator